MENLCNHECKECCRQLGCHIKLPKEVILGKNVDGWPVGKVVEHEHRYYPNSRQKSDTCIICGFDPHK